MDIPTRSKVHADGTIDLSTRTPNIGEGQGAIASVQDFPRHGRARGAQEDRRDVVEAGPDYMSNQDLTPARAISGTTARTWPRAERIMSAAAPPSSVRRDGDQEDAHGDDGRGLVPSTCITATRESAATPRRPGLYSIRGDDRIPTKWVPARSGPRRLAGDTLALGKGAAENASEDPPAPRLVHASRSARVHR